jgi:hypothetical protein
VKQFKRAPERILSDLEERRRLISGFNTIYIHATPLSFYKNPTKRVKPNFLKIQRVAVFIMVKNEGDTAFLKRKRKIKISIRIINCKYL